jgi:NADH-quinone oxidoreductase subunit E
MNIPDTLAKKADEIFSRYPANRREAALVPLMFEAQKELGLISPDTERWLSEIVGVSLVKVREVLTFYSMMRTEPIGKHLIQFCHNIACCLVGAEELQKHIERTLRLKNGETSPDGLFTLKYVECLGGCSWAPMMLVNEDQYFQLTPDKFDRIIQGIRAGTPVAPDNPTPLIGNVGREVTA